MTTRSSSSWNEAQGGPPSSSGTPSLGPPRSVRTPAGALERLSVVDGSFVAAWGNLFMQIRRGDLQLETFDQIAGAAMRSRLLAPRGALHAALVVTEDGAPIPAEPVRARQKAFVTEFLKNPSSRMAVVVAGKTLDASLLRSASRGVVQWHKHLRVLGEVADACEWLASELHLDRSQLEAVVAQARAIAERELAPQP